MRKNKQNNRRVMIAVVIISVLALAGVTMIKVEPARADRAHASASLESGSAETGTAGTATDAAPEGGTAVKPSVGAAVIKMISALAIVIVALYGGLYLLRRLMGRRHGGSLPSGTLEVLQTTYVGQHKAISLVKIGKRSVLVGVTDNQISTLTELDAEETDEILGEAAPSTANESFSRALSGAAEKLKMIGLKKKQAALET